MTHSAPTGPARIVGAAGEQDVDWGTFSWLTFIAGVCRGELLGPTWDL